MSEKFGLDWLNYDFARVQLLIIVHQEMIEKERKQAREQERKNKK